MAVHLGACEGATMQRSVEQLKAAARHSANQPAD
jgi:hypothetical protein